MFATPSLINLPFFMAGGLKILYDLALYVMFAPIHLPEEETLRAKFTQR
jgi:hypothetical protein